MTTNGFYIFYASSLRPIPTNEHLNRLYYAAEHRATHVIMEIAGA